MKSGKPIVAIIQARMGASRLPAKMMLWLHSYPVIEWDYRRLSKVRLVDKIVFALPDSKADDILAGFLEQKGANIYRGSEEDVLLRFYEAAFREKSSTIIRVCADNPLISGPEIDRLIGYYQKGNYDYAYNHIPRGNSYPDGLGAEITSMAILEELNQKASTPAQREHVFNYIWEHKESYCIGTFDPEDESICHPELKLDLDTIEDYARLLNLPVNPEMSARQIVSQVLKYQQNRDKV